VPRCQKLQMTA